MMCAEQHKQLLFSTTAAKKSPSHHLRDIDIPPRKLHHRHHHAAEEEEAFFRKFLPYNDSDDELSDPYASDHFRMYEFKVRRCTRSRSHDWTDCPFAHPGEKARRRDPRRYHYSGTVCPEFRRGSCSKGDNCEFAHGVFECWLHPARYRTEPCKDGKSCKRKVCFFAHSPRQLRLLPDPSSPPEERKLLNLNSNNHHCHCVYCSHCVSASPTSTLMSMSSSHFSPPLSPSLSPPLSPATTIMSNSNSRLMSKFGGLTYKEALTELMSSMEGMNMIDSPSPSSGTRMVNTKSNLSWVDVNNFDNNNGIGGGDEYQPQFVLSPASSSVPPMVQQQDFVRRVFVDDRANEGGLNCPDFGWVNDLLT